MCIYVYRKRARGRDREREREGYVASPAVTGIDKFTIKSTRLRSRNDGPNKFIITRNR